VEVHAVMMAIVWILVMPLAICFPVLFKSRRGTTRVNWFLWHRVLAGVGVGLMLIGALIAVVNNPTEHFQSRHGKLGIVVVVVVGIQVMIAIRRPHVDELSPTRARAIWECTHWYVASHSLLIVLPFR
jgi:hypothetical protein